MRYYSSDANVLKMSKAHNDFTYAWSITKDFADRVNDAIAHGNATTEEANDLRAERAKLFEKTAGHLAEFEALAGLIEAEIDGAQDNDSRYVMQQIAEYRNHPALNEFKAALASYNSDSDAEPNA